MKSNASVASALTFMKFVAWAGIAAAIECAASSLTNLEIPVAYKGLVITVLAAVLKAAATWVQTKQNEQREATNQ